MNLNPELVAISRLPWQLFGTLTFKKVVPAAICGSLVMAWIRCLAADSGIHFRRVVWVLRGERGEATGRFHYHVLVCGLPPAALSPVSCVSLMRLWERLGGGMARVRTVDCAAIGVEYVLKGLEAQESQGANVYEMTKFGTADGVTVSQSLSGMCSKGRFLLGGTRITRHKADGSKQS